MGTAVALLPEMTLKAGLDMMRQSPAAWGTSQLWLQTKDNMIAFEQGSDERRSRQSLHRP